MQVQGVSTALCGLLETGLVHGQPALLPGGEGLSPAATGVLEEARTAVVLAAHLMADKVFAWCFSDEADSMSGRASALVKRRNGGRRRLAHGLHAVPCVL